VSIWDDGLNSQGMPMPFDSEGVPKQRVDIVSKGVVKSPVYDRYTASKAGATSTGHALPPYFPPFMRSIGPVGLNLFMAPGDSNLDDMIQSTKRGLYITRFWYTRLVHPRDCIVTGMTRDGVFMVGETRLLKSEYGSHAKCVPALKLSSFNFTGITV
jgi:predicted Zn-dependent protease